MSGFAITCLTCGGTGRVDVDIGFAVRHDDGKDGAGGWGGVWLVCGCGRHEVVCETMDGLWEARRRGK